MLCSSLFLVTFILTTAILHFLFFLTIEFFFFSLFSSFFCLFLSFSCLSLKVCCVFWIYRFPLLVLNLHLTNHHSFSLFLRLSFFFFTLTFKIFHHWFVIEGFARCGSWNMIGSSLEFKISCVDWWNRHFIVSAIVITVWFLVVHAFVIIKAIWSNNGKFLLCMKDSIPPPFLFKYY